MSPVAIREEEMGARPSGMGQSLRRRLGRHDGLVGTRAPELLQDPQHLVEVATA